MKFFTTPAQRKIFRWYWKNHRPFGLEALLEKKRRANGSPFCVEKSRTTIQAVFSFYLTTNF